MAISSRVLMSGYRFLENKASNSCNCCDVKWVLCLLWRLSLMLFLLLCLPDLTSLLSSSWLSGLSGLWLGSSDPGSATKERKELKDQDWKTRSSDMCVFCCRLVEEDKLLVLMYGKVIKSWRGLKSSVTRWLRAAKLAAAENTSRDSHFEGRSFEFHASLPDFFWPQKNHISALLIVI